MSSGRLSCGCGGFDICDDDGCCCVVGDGIGLGVSVYVELNCSRDVIVVDLVVGKGRGCRGIKRRW